MRKTVCGVVAGVIFASNVQADNGEVAIAKPAIDISVDGDLSDWPADTQYYPIRYDGEQQRVATEPGFDASFGAAFDATDNVLYLAVKVEDDIHVAPASDDIDWERRDGVIAYVDFNHTASGSGATLYLATGAHYELLSDETSWDPTVAATTRDSADVAVAREKTTTVYEWRIRSPADISGGVVLGVDFLVGDQDDVAGSVSSRLVSWGPGFGKSQAGGRTGDLLLVDNDSGIGTVAGQIQLTGVQTEDRRRLRVRLTSEDEPRRWLQVLADERGQYNAELPAGTYAINSADRLLWAENSATVVAPAKPATVRVKANETVTAMPLQVTPTPLPLAIPERGVLFEFGNDDGQGFDDAVAALMEHFDVPGVSLALVKDGKLAHYRTYGTRNAFSAEPIEANTLFEAASITKPVFAFAVNRLAERGVIDLDRPLHEYLVFDDIAHDDRYKKITARHVLSHQTGFPNWRWMNNDGQLDIKFYPGIQYGYSGEGFEYLGRVVAAITGEPLETVVRNETVEIMGFGDNTFFADGADVRARASRGHLSGMSGPHDFPEAIGVAHSMYTEAHSFSGFMLSLLAQKGLSEQGYAKMLEPQVATPLAPEQQPPWPGRYSLGFHLMNSPYGLVYGHGGNNGNFTCHFELYPEHDVGFVVFTNADTGSLLIDALREYLIIGNAE
ncbi:MAG: serine hydrolase [Pseudomonadota bacterium]